MADLDDKDKEIELLRRALRELWKATMWGAGKAAAFEANRRIMVRAGVPDIGD